MEVKSRLNRPAIRKVATRRSSHRQNKKTRRGGFFLILAERVGFEPTVRFNVRLISSQVHSTTLPPLLVLQGALDKRRFLRWECCSQLKRHYSIAPPVARQFPTVESSCRTMAAQKRPQALPIAAQPAISASHMSSGTCATRAVFLESVSWPSCSSVWIHHSSILGNS